MTFDNLPGKDYCTGTRILTSQALIRGSVWPPTYAVRASGDSMKGSGIEEGDILVVDTAIEPTNKSIVIASINGEQTVKRLLISGKTVSLAPENHNYQTTEITGDTDFRTLGVVTWVIRKTG